MGGMHGGDLHDIGSGQRGMTGRGGTGGNQSGNDHAQTEGGARIGAPGNEQRAEAGRYQDAEIQQSAQREGMGQHRHRGRGNERKLDADVTDDLGSRERGAPDVDSGKSG